MLDLDLCCPIGALETHEDLNWHGDLCRHWDGGYSCPTGCNVKDPGPYCVQEGTADSPCRIKAGEDCSPSICPASHLPCLVDTYWAHLFAPPGRYATYVPVGRLSGYSPVCLHVDMSCLSLSGHTSSSSLK